MARGPKKHQKRINAPKSWMLDKLQGIYAPRPSQGPHKLRECLPLYVILRHRLKFAVNAREVTQILKDKEANVKVDNKIRRDKCFPAGIMDVVTIEKTGQSYRILYDTKGRFVLRTLKEDESKFKLLKVINKGIGPNQIPYIVTHDARTIRFPHPDIAVGDSIKYDFTTNTIIDWVKLDLGNTCYITAGNNIGRVGLITHVEKHPGNFDIVHIKDSIGKQFSTRLGNVFMIGKNKKAWISLPKDNGLYLNALEQSEQRTKKTDKPSAASKPADKKK